MTNGIGMGDDKGNHLERWNRELFGEGKCALSVLGVCFVGHGGSGASNGDLSRPANLPAGHEMVS